MKDFQHPNVMSSTGVCLDAGVGVSIVMPFLANGSLLDYLKRERNNLHIKDDAELDTVLSYNNFKRLIIFLVCKCRFYPYESYLYAFIIRLPKEWNIFHFRNLSIVI